MSFNLIPGLPLGELPLQIVCQPGTAAQDLGQETDLHCVKSMSCVCFCVCFLTITDKGD